MIKLKLNTQEWADAFKESLNHNPNYKKSAKTWEGALILIFEAEGINLNNDVRLWLDLWHGTCNDARFLDDGENLPHEFTISSTESYWNDLVTGVVDPSKAMMSGKIKIKGNIGKLMRFPKAAAYIIKYLKRLLIEW